MNAQMQTDRRRADDGIEAASIVATLRQERDGYKADREALVEAMRGLTDRALKAEAEVARLRAYIDGLPYPSDVYQAQSEADRLRAAVTEAEATLKHIQPYVGLLVQYLPRCTHLVATAREHANRALGSVEIDEEKSS